MEQIPAFAEVRRGCVAALYGIARTIDIHVRAGAGADMLALEPRRDWPSLDEFDLASLGFEKPLEVIYRYAFYAEVGDTDIHDDWEEGNLGRLQSLLRLTSNDLIDLNEDEVWDIHSDDQTGRGSFHRMVRLATARYHLDRGTVSVDDLAVLADMEERSIRNALKTEGIAIQKGAVGHTLEGEYVDRHQVLPWLRSRRRFIETKRIGSLNPVPDSLKADEIPAFIRRQAQECLTRRGMGRSARGLKTAEHPSERSVALANLGRSVGWTEAQVEALLQISSVEEICPDDCPVIARMLGLDAQWWTDQVMRARFPEAMKELAPPVAQTAHGPSLLNEQEKTLDVVLTDAGIRNGYFDIERRYADRFFPADSFGTKGAERFGKEVLIHHDQKKSPYRTDIRIKSQSLASPRKRFSAYFTAHGATPGDVLRIERLGEREYRLSFQSK